MKPRVEVVRRGLSDVRSDGCVAFLFEGEKKLAGLPPDLQRAADADLARRGFRGERGTAMTVTAGDGASRRVAIVAGLGPRASFDAEAARLAAAAAGRRLQVERVKIAAVVPPGEENGRLTLPQRTTALVEGLLLGFYRFERFITDDARRAHRPDLIIVAAGRREQTVARAVDRAQALVAGAILARDLVNTPAGHLTPDGLAQEIRRAFRGSGVRVNVLDEQDLARERMGALLAVGRGSDQPPRLVHLVHRPKGRSRARLALVGKGVTFDAGGYDLKSQDHMADMKDDMAGAAAVAGAILALSRLAAPVEIHGFLGLVENLVSGRAYKPGDVLQTRSGKTVEVKNTDAEGRLVLADALDYARTTARPTSIVDVATLTGACAVALGPECGGLFSNNDALAGRLLEAARKAGEKLWRLPLFREYREHFRSTVADLANVGKREGGAISAALFLETFVDGKTPWAHLDIAGPAFLEDEHAFWGRGATGAGVPTLVEFGLSL